MSDEIINIKFKFMKEQRIRIKNKIVLCTHFRRYSVANSFDPRRKTKIVEMAVYGRHNVLRKFAFFADVEGKGEFQFLRYRKAL